VNVQQSTTPNIRIPRIVKTCIARIREPDGLTAEGIFRLSPSKSQLEEAKEEVDKGNYDIKLDPYVAAALLKEWLRLLSEPIIPLYDKAVECAKAISIQESEDNSNSTNPTSSPTPMDVIDKLDPLNQEILRQIASLCQEIVLPNNANHNKMSFESLGIVFAPCFLRCASNDPNVIFANTRFETKFTILLLQMLK
jgi:hypothetical protein